MSRLKWRDKALKDIQRLYRFIAIENQAAAERAIKTIQASIQILKTHPHAGRPAEEIGDGYRQWTVLYGNSGYIVLYNIQPDEVIIHAVRHQKEVGYL
jgi:plasmid stabilization system protein ParE